MADLPFQRVILRRQPAYPFLLHNPSMGARPPVRVLIYEATVKPINEAEQVHLIPVVVPRRDGIDPNTLADTTTKAQARLARIGSGTPEVIKGTWADIVPSGGGSTRFWHAAEHTNADAPALVQSDTIGHFLNFIFRDDYNRLFALSGALRKVTGGPPSVVFLQTALNTVLFGAEVNLNQAYPEEPDSPVHIQGYPGL